MKKLSLIILALLIFEQTLFAEVSVFSDNNKFGLKDSKGNIVTEAKYKKLIRLGENGWIIQDGNKFGLLNDNNEILVEPKYNQAERVLGKFAKLRKGEKYGIFNEYGKELLPVQYSSIDLLYGGLYVTSKNHLYGISDLDGKIILDNIFDDIYMPDFNTLIIIYNGKQLEIKRQQGEKLSIPQEIQTIDNNTSSSVKFSDITESPLASTGYYSVTFTDYILKIFSSISPSYEETIDELMFSQGADTVSILMKLSWIPKFPFVYAKKYYNNVTSPFSGPLSKTKKSLRHRIKN